MTRPWAKLGSLHANLTPPTVSPLSMVLSIWLFFLQKTLVFRPKTYNSQIAPKYDNLHTSVVSALVHAYCYCRNSKGLENTTTMTAQRSKESYHWVNPNQSKIYVSELSGDFLVTPRRPIHCLLVLMNPFVCDLAMWCRMVQFDTT